MKHTFVAVFAIVLGVVVLGCDLQQDVAYVRGAAVMQGWTPLVMATVLSLCVRNLLLIAGLLLAVAGRAWGWYLLGAVALWALIRRAIWFYAAAAAFATEHGESLSYLAAYSTADLLFRLLCVALLADLLRQRMKGTS